MVQSGFSIKFKKSSYFGIQTFIEITTGAVQIKVVIKVKFCLLFTSCVIKSCRFERLIR